MYIYPFPHQERVFFYRFDSFITHHGTKKQSANFPNKQHLEKASEIERGIDFLLRGNYTYLRSGNR